MEGIANVNADRAVNLMGGMVAQLKPRVEKKLMAKLFVGNPTPNAWC